MIVSTIIAKDVVVIAEYSDTGEYLGLMQGVLAKAVRNGASKRVLQHHR